MNFTIAPRTILPTDLPRLSDRGRGLDAMGTWTFRGLDVPPEGGVHRYECDGITIEVPHGGTCDRCGMSIQWIVTLTRADGWCQVGADCADYLTVGEDGRAAIREAMAAERAARREAAREIVREERRVVRDAARDAEIAKVVAAHQAELAQLATLASAGGFAAGFGQSVSTQIRSGRAMSQRQREVLAKLLGDILSRKPSRHLGTVGGKVTFTGVCTWASYKRSERYHGKVDYMFSFRTDDDALVVWFASTGPDKLVNGARVTVTATVKAHGEFRGEPQTVILRAKVLVHKTAAEIAAEHVTPGQWRGGPEHGITPYTVVEIADKDDSSGRCLVTRYDVDGTFSQHPYDPARIVELWPTVLDGAPAELPRLTVGETRMAGQSESTCIVGTRMGDGRHDVTLVLTSGETIELTAMDPATIIKGFPTIVA